MNATEKTLIRCLAEVCGWLKSLPEPRPAGSAYIESLITRTVNLNCEPDWIEVRRADGSVECRVPNYGKPGVAEHVRQLADAAEWNANPPRGGSDTIAKMSATNLRNERDRHALHTTSERKREGIDDA